MPEMTFSVRWPDGRVDACYSPSLVMHDHLTPGTTYRVDDFTRRSGTALDGAQVVACISAWPSSRTAGAADIAEDRWTKRFNLFDQARALENQIVWVAANQVGTFGSMRFVANAKVVGPGGDVLATTGTEAGLAIAGVDLDEALDTARRAMFHLRDRRPDTYPVHVKVPAHA